MTVRLQDIAADLNLSKMTISKVLRGQADVSAATRARVLKRVKEMNYRPNISARGLRTGQTFSVGLVIPSIRDPFCTEVARELADQLRPSGYGLFLASAESEPERERHELEQQLSWPVDAIVLASVQAHSDLEHFAMSQRAPLVLIHREAPVLKNNSVALCEDEIGELAVAHLVQRRCKSIAHIRGPRNLASDLRFSGFRIGLLVAGLKFRPEFVSDADGDNDEYRCGAAAARRLLQAPTRPDGIVCHSDLSAVAAMDVLLESGVHIPRDIAVIGCGNEASICEMRMPLTSVSKAPDKVAKHAARMVLKLLGEGTDKPLRNVKVSPEVIARESTAR
jgi:LacI family transcriptional regulator